jgi:hypothetical protein
MNVKKWLISDPVFLFAIVFMGFFNYSFDQFFRANIHLNPYFSFLYVFQYNLILPLVNVSFLCGLFYGLRYFKMKREERVYSNRK